MGVIAGRVGRYAEAINSRDARRVRPAPFITARIGAVEQRLIGEIELRRPVGNETSRPFPPFLIENTRDRITLSDNKSPTGNFCEAFLIVGPAQTASELYVRQHLIIDLAETSIGVQAIRIFAAEIIVTVAVDLAQRIGIDIGATQSEIIAAGIVWVGKGRRTAIGNRRIEGIMRRLGIAFQAVFEILQKSQHIGEYIIIFKRLIIEI